MKKLLFLIRLILFLGLVFLAIKPVLTRSNLVKNPRTALLIDNSKSMGVRDPDERFQVARKIALEILKKYPNSTMFSFSNEAKEITKEELSALKPLGNQTDIAEAIHQVFQFKKFQRGILISDGRQVGAGDPVVEAASLGIPLVVIGLGNNSFYKDVAVRSIQAPPFAFRNLPTSISATISAIGLKGKKISVRLKEGEKILGLQTIDAASGEVETSVTFSWVPAGLGSKVLTVETDQFQGEMSTVNNKKSFILNVGRDRFRVLYICGLPGWEYGFLRHQFKSDPAVELVTFVILRNSGNILNIPDFELSLIPFPTQDELIRQMSTFDLIVFEEFNFSQFGLTPGLFQAIRKKVTDGGSLLILGGTQVFSPGSPYYLAGIQDMIPVVFENESNRYSPDKFQFKPKIYSHPILKLEFNPEENMKIWNRLPDLEGLTLVPGVKDGASKIAVAVIEGREYPVLSAWNFGSGRVAALLTRTTWRWSMLEGKEPNPQYAYQQFWKNMVLWLTGAEQFKAVRVGLEGKSLRLDETGLARIWVYDEYFKPISDVDIKVQLIKPNGIKQEIRPDQETTGVFSFPVKGEELGTYKLQVWIFRRGKRLGADSCEFKVLEGLLEEEDLRPDHALLNELAHSSGGRFFTENEYSLKALDEFSKENEKTGGEKILVWTSPWLFLGISLILIFEWVLRKRKGYL